MELLKIGKKKKMAKLKNFGMITEVEFTGKTLEDATSKAQNDGFTVRIVERDGDSFLQHRPCVFF